MNILFLTYQGGIAGSTFSVSYLCRGLAQKGHKVVLGCKSNARYTQLLKDSGVEIIYLPFKNKFDLKSMRMIRDIVKKYKIDIINSQASIDRYLSIFATKFFGLKSKLIHTRRQRPNSSGKFFHGKFYTWGTDKIVAVSEGVKRRAMNFMGVPESHLKVIHNGTPKEKYKEIVNADVTDLKEKFNIKKDDFVIGCISRRKQQIQLIKALNHITKTKLKVIFVGIKKNDLDIHEDEFPRHHEIIFSGGRVNPQEALRYYRIFNVHVLPSITEGLSQTLLEAMFLEVPVIATNASGNPDLIEPGKDGFLFKNGDTKQLAGQILELKKNKQIYNEFVASAKKKVKEEFSIKQVVNNYEKFFQELLQK